MRSIAKIVCLSVLVLLGVGGYASLDKRKEDCAENGALATALAPKFAPEYYIEQGVKYFQTMQSDVPIWVQPNYSQLAIRWEWEPWLLLTGYKKNMVLVTDPMLKLTPTSYDKLDCRFFAVQPFCRCHVVFNYSGMTCPIYEEFTFNDAGEITFIEAWSDFPSLLPMGPGADSIWDESDYWALNDANRLATKLPGLGSATGKIAIGTTCMDELAERDTDVAELLKRLNRPAFFWFKQLFTHFEELENGCYAPAGEVYPYYEPANH
jgi:hypothetical protein